MRHTNPHRRRGMGIFLIIMAISLAGLALIFLAHGTSHLAFQSSQAQSDAYLTNIEESALTWAQHNGAKLATLQEGDSLSLDITALKIPEGTAALEMVKRQGTEAKIRVKSFCLVHGHKMTRTTEQTTSLASAPTTLP